MSLAFKELAGSPIEEYGPDGLTATRHLLCAWDERHQVVEQLLGDGYLFGGSCGASYPGHACAVAMRVRCEPFTDDLVAQTLDSLTEGLNRYEGFAKLTVRYELLSPLDLADAPATEPGTVLTYRQEVGSEYVTPAAGGLSWSEAASTAVAADDVPVVRVPIVKHRLTWHRAAAPPWTAIRQCVGTVNASTFLGATTTTMLFDGATAEQEFFRIDELEQTQQGWRIDYVFREKAVKTGSGNIVGFNHAFRSQPAETAGWDELVDTAGQRLYRQSDFAQLFLPETL